jgi:pimeloyl-ACP methyl ester carboxylesterase
MTQSSPESPRRLEMKRLSLLPAVLLILAVGVGDGRPANAYIEAGASAAERSQDPAIPGATQIFVSALSESGTTYTAPAADTYRFTIADGAFRTCEQGDCHTGWRTKMFLYVNRPVIWSAQCGEDNVGPGDWDYELGTWTFYSTRQRAEEVSRGMYVDVPLAKDDYVTLVIWDCRGVWGDNSGGITIQVSLPTPVVLVHGVNDSKASWGDYVNDFLPSIGRVGYPVDTLDTGKDDHVAVSIAENASRLRQYISKVKADTQATQVDIVAHSMGGLISRYYIANLMNRDEPDVRQLIMLGTPNGGSNSAQLLEIAHYGVNSLFNQPYIETATYQLTPAYLAGFNSRVTQRWGVPFYGVAGNYERCLLRFPADNPVERHPNDVVVWAGSVFAIPLEKGWVYPSPKLGQGSCEGDHRGMLKNASLQGGKAMFDLYVNPRLTGGSPQTMLLPDSVASQVSASGTAYDELSAIQFTDVQTGILQPGGTTEFLRSVAPITQTAFIVMADPDQVAVSLIDPTGRVITPSTSDPLIQFIQMNDFMFMTSYTVDNPIPGTWRTVVDANGDTPTGGLGLVVLGETASDLQLTVPVNAATESTFPMPVSVLAQLRNGAAPVVGSDVHATLISPDSVETAIALLDDGSHNDGAANDGVYGHTFTPTTPGTYRANIQASGIQAGAPFNRAAVWVADVHGRWHVAPGGNDGNDCLSPGAACATINGALQKHRFMAGDTVLVAAGTYTGIGAEVVLVDKSATISGGWDGAFTAQNGVSTIDGEDARGSITVKDGLAAIIERVTVQNGSASRGGGIFTSGADLTLRDSIITQNRSTTDGGGLAITNNSSAAIEDTQVFDNAAGSTGGGLSVMSGSSAAITRARIYANAAGTDEGGGLVVRGSGSSLRLVSSWVVANTAPNNEGGGLSVGGGSAYVENSIVAGNASGTHGGGFWFAEGGPYRIVNSHIVGNQSPGHGAALASSYGVQVEATNTLIIGNQGQTGIADRDASGSTFLLSYCDTFGNSPDRTDGATFERSQCLGTPPEDGVNPRMAGGALPDRVGPDFANQWMSYAYRLQAGSPAINAGTPIGAPSTDIEGTPRGAAPDIGAYESKTRIFLPLVLRNG